MTPDQYVELRDRIALFKARTTSLLLRKADDNTFTPPSSVRSAAARGLELREKWKRGGLSNGQASSQGIGSGVQRAVNLKNGDAISLATVKRMAAFFSRHAKNYRPGEKEPDGGPTAGTVAWMLWGGNAGKSWAEGIVNRVEKANAGYVPSTGWSPNDGKPEFMAYAKDGEGGAAPGPAGGPDAGDVHVPTTQRQKPKKLKDRVDKLLERLAKAINRWPAGTPGAKGGQFAPKQTGGGGLASQAAPSGLPAAPKFATSNVAVRRENEGHANKLRALAEAGDLAGLKAYTGFSPQSQKLTEYKAALIAHVGSQAPSAKPLPDFKAALIDDKNVNAATHNAKVLLIEQHAKNGAADKILGMSFGVNTYGKKQAKLANATLTALGSTHQVTPGQKAGTHPALQGGKPPAPPPPAPPAPPPPAPPKPAPVAAPAAAPAPAPAAGGTSYKPAKTLDGAVAQLQALGVKVTRLSATSQEQWKKDKIANAPPDKKALFEKWYGPKKTKNYLTDKSFLDVLNAIGPEAARLKDEFPALLDGVNLIQKSPGPKALGWYAFSDKSIALRKPSGFKPPKALKEGDVPWTVSTSNNSAGELVDTFRHEAAHALDIGVHKWKMTGELVQAANAGLPSNSGPFALLKYVGSKHSKYGGTKPEEATAELVALYTSASYKPGTISKPLEDVLTKYLKKPPPFSKAREDVEENPDFQSISIPEPPEGYELESVDGIDIRFRAPNGEIVQYVDMVKQGLFGPEEDDA